MAILPRSKRGLGQSLHAALFSVFALVALVAFIPGQALSSPILPPATAEGASPCAVAGDDCQSALGLPVMLPLGAAEADFSHFVGGAWTHPDASPGEPAVAPIPLPAAAWLILAGLGALVFAGRRSRNGASPTRRADEDQPVEPMLTCLKAPLFPKPAASSVSAGASFPLPPG